VHRVSSNRCLQLLLCVSLAWVPRTAHAGEGEVSVASDDDRARAAEHFERGVSAFDARRFADAEQEFRRAYELGKEFVVLYNLGEVRSALGRPVEAIAAYEEFLARGGATVDDDKRKLVLEEMERQRARVGAVLVQTDPPTARLWLDGVEIEPARRGQALSVAAGRHTLLAILDGHNSETREIEVAPQAQQELSIVLRPVAPPPVAPTHPRPIARPSTQRPSVVAVERARPRPKSALSYVVGGVGALAVVGGTIVALDGVRRASNAKKGLARAETGTVWDAAKQDYDAARAQNVVGWAVIGGGAALLSVGAVIWLATGSEGREQAAEVRPWTSIDASGVTARTSW
jgi:hypothetical protein